jgi:hypothetical protein
MWGTSSENVGVEFGVVEEREQIRHLNDEEAVVSEVIVSKCADQRGQGRLSDLDQGPVNNLAQFSKRFARGADVDENEPVTIPRTPGTYAPL